MNLRRGQRRRDERHRAARRGGFTLPEIIVAIVIGATLLTTAVTFALSMGELWGNGSEMRLFDQHVRGVTRFLENVFQHARPPPVEAESSVQAGATQTAETPVAWQNPRGSGAAAANNQLLTFELPESPGVFAWPEQPLPFVVCALRVDRDEGLFLQWKSRLEIDFADEAPRELRVSPFVTAVMYYYYDNDDQAPKWEERNDPRMGANRQPDLPQRVKLTFSYHGLTREVNLILPGTAAGAPVY